MERIAALLALGACAAGAHGAGLRVTATAGGQPLEGAIVSLHSPAARAAVRPQAARMDQRDTRFAPRVLAVTAGTSVEFPNSDNVRHQVYSFSPARRFELPLYSGTPAAPVVFDTPGTVELGCNIHDGMIGYIIVLDTPYHAVTDAGGVAVMEAPVGQYELRTWHEHQAGEPVVQALELEPAGTALALPLRIETPPPPAPADPALERLRALQRGTDGRPGG